jgi:hypothetical protein
MKNISLILLVFFFVSCSKTEKFDLYISNTDYNFNVETGEFRIDWYKNYKTNVEFTKDEKEQLNKLVYKYNIENLTGENYVYGKENLIMPNFNDEISLTTENKLKSKIFISTQVNLEKTKLNKTEIDIFKFKQELFILLNKNKNFKINMDTLEIAKKTDKRLFM